MRKLLLFTAILASISITAQPTLDYAVQTWAEVESSPAKITISWLPVNGAESYTLFRKEKGGVTWGSSIASLDAVTTFHEDTDVEPQVSYEYKIQKSGNVLAFGYVNAGIEIPAMHHRGRLLLLVDSLFSEGLSVEISQLTEDLIGDGWQVVRYDVDREGTAIEIKQIIVDEYNADPLQLDAVFCLGHVPVPYSGNYNPDGHANHVGAWSADGYYGDVDGSWTDNVVNNTSAAQTRNHNVPGDGKFDQTYFATDLEMQVGRVDFANMPAFSLSEEELLRVYLNKDHVFRTAQIQIEMQAVIDDNFGGFGGEAFASSAWKSFAPLLHPDNVAAGDYRTSMDTSSYIWSYGCGGGSYTSCSGVGTTANFASDSLQGIFSCLFGSYFGDWDSQNNLMRASLGTGTMLTNCWSGRPQWYFHHMGLGENIGYSAKISMNNTSSIYYTPLSFLGRIVAMGLMGDPTLRMHNMQPASNLTASFNGFDVELNWTISANPEAGYYVYRSDEFNSHYTLLNEEPLFVNAFTDECIETSGIWFYMVRATKLEMTPSGTYHNLSQGIFQNVEAVVETPIASFNPEVILDSLTVENTSTSADSWQWFFGDGTMSNEFQPAHVYQSSGDYDVVLIASNECFQDTFSMQVSVIFTATKDLLAEAGITVFPNPGKDWFTLNSEKALSNAEIRIYDAFGKLITKKLWQNGALTSQFSLEGLPEGIYFVQIREGKNVGAFKIIKQKE